MTSGAVLDDGAFLGEFEAGRPPGGGLRHRDHLRLTWLYIRREGIEAGAERIAQGIRHFALRQGAPGKYHETLTRV